MASARNLCFCLAGTTYLPILLLVATTRTKCIPRLLQLTDSPPAAATTTRGKRARSAFEGVFVPAVSQPLDKGEESEVELEDCLSGTEEMGENLDRWEFSETHDRRQMSTEELKRKFADAEEVGESSDDDDVDDDPDVLGGSGRRRARGELQRSSSQAGATGYINFKR